MTRVLSSYQVLRTVGKLFKRESLQPFNQMKKIHTTMEFVQVTKRQTRLTHGVIIFFPDALGGLGFFYFFFSLPNLSARSLEGEGAVHATQHKVFRNRSAESQQTWQRRPRRTTGEPTPGDGARNPAPSRSQVGGRAEHSVRPPSPHRTRFVLVS